MKAKDALKLGRRLGSEALSGARELLHAAAQRAARPDPSERMPAADDSTEGQQSSALQARDTQEALSSRREEPPVVARLMVEIRSDGSRTVARGALKDELTGEQVSLEAEGTTPLALAAKLAKSLLVSPLALRRVSEGLRELPKTESPSSPKTKGEHTPGEDR